MASERLANLRGDIGVGMFLERVRKAKERVALERPTIRGEELFLEIFWREEAIREEIADEAERVSMWISFASNWWGWCRYGCHGDHRTETEDGCGLCAPKTESLTS